MKRQGMWQTGYYGYLSDYLWWWVALGSLIVHTWCFFRLVPKTWRPRVRLVLGNLLIVACLLTVVGLAAESYLRFLSVATDSYGATLTCKRWHVAYARVNSLGHRDSEWVEEKPPGVRRIAFVGDSFTYGWGIDDVEDRFTNILQQRFDVRSPDRIEVMNVAWGAWDTQQQIRWIARMIEDYSVDEVVLCYLPNDIEKILPVTKDFDPFQPPRTSLIRTDSSFLLDYLFYRLYAPSVPSVFNHFDWLADGFHNPRTWQEHQTDLGRMISLCRDAGVTLRVAILPFLLTSGNRYDAREIHGLVRRFFSENHVPVVDLLPVIEGQNPVDLTVNAHDHHPNASANQRFADAIWNAFYDDSKP